MSEGPYTTDVQIRWLQDTVDKQAKRIAELQAERDRLTAQVAALLELHATHRNGASQDACCVSDYESELRDALDAEPVDTPCPSCNGTGQEFSGVEYMGQREVVGCVDCEGTGKAPADTGNSDAN